MYRNDILAYKRGQALTRLYRAEFLEYNKFKTELGGKMPYKTIGAFRRARRADSEGYNEVKGIYRNLQKDLTKESDSSKINITIDNLTPCLINAKTGEVIRTVIEPITITSNKTPGFGFDWSKANKDEDGTEYNVNALKIEGKDRIEGLIAWRAEKRVIHVNLVESAEHNRGDNKDFEGVGGHLFAEAVKQSYEVGNVDGGVYFTPKTNLINHYSEKLGAILLPNGNMFIEGEAARSLYDKYYGNKK